MTSVEGDFRVGEFVVRPELHEIVGEDGHVKGVEPRSMEVLLHLAAHVGELCTRQQIFEAVWGESFVGEEVLTHCIWDLRRAFGDPARRPRYIQTLPRKGYRLLAEVSSPSAVDGDPRYRLIEEVGAGAMGVIWRAEDTRLGRIVALKFLPEAWNRDERAKRRFVREARAAAALEHPNLCTLHEIDETENGCLFLVMPFYDGDTLESLVERGAVPWPRAASITAAAGRGLAAAHDRGIVHRDVKPANIMIVRRDGRDEVKVLDFGVARFGNDATRLTATAFSPGTPAYKSPEQSRGEDVDARSDVWALGVVLYELLSGRTPFRAEYEQAIVHAILERAPAALTQVAPEIPSGLAEVVYRALDKEPARRFQSMAEMVAAIEAVETAVESAVESAAAPAEDRGEGLADRDDPSASTSPVPVAGTNHRGTKHRGFSWLDRPRRGPAAVALVASLFALIFLAAYIARPRHPSGIRVAILPPIIEGGAEADRDTLEAAASGVRLAVESGLARLDGISPLDPSELSDQTQVAAAARAAAADEVMSMSVERWGDLARVSLRRLDDDGRVLWADAVEAPISPDDALILASAIHAKLRQAFPDHRLRDGAVELAVADADYRVYLDLRRQHDAGVDASEETLATVDDLLESSPGFLEGHIVAAEIAWRLGRRFRNGALLERAATYASKAAGLAPNDPRPPFVQMRIAVASEREADAADALARLESLIPGSPKAVFARSLYLAAQGDLDGAIAEGRELVELRPSWKFFFHLVTLEDRAGQPDRAREHLRQLLERSPENRRGLSRLAELEMVYGDLEAARALYVRLLERSPSLAYLANLGVVQFLLGDYSEAVATYQKASELAPQLLELRFNIAEAQSALGQKEAADAGFRQVFEQLNELDAADRLDPATHMMRALCLAHLGDARLAVRETLATLQDHPENAEVIYQGAMVYALVADRNSALVTIEQALGLGTQPRWFRVPAFAGLEGDPALETLLVRSGG